MSVITQFLEILGSLGLFLYGMKVMSGGIQRAAGEKLHSILNHMTRNRFVGVITGLLITALVQSSSVTTVMVVSFVNAGLLSLGQAIGVIMGANIGTTVTAWIITIVGKFSISSLALPFIGLGIPLVLSKKLKRTDIGETLIGFGILFLGLDFLKHSVPDLKNNTALFDFLANFNDDSIFHFLFFVALGTIITFIVQSSSAAMAITITLAAKGWIGFYPAAAIVLGENIGTTITAYLASIGASTNAKRAARAHLLFNLIGVFWMAFLFVPFIKMVDLILPGDVFGSQSRETITAHLALFHTLFNTANTLLLVWFTPQIEKIVTKWVKDKDGSIAGRYSLKYISTGMQDTSELNLLNAKKEIGSMLDKVREMYLTFVYVFNNPDKKLGDKVESAKKLEDYVDQMQEELSKYLVECELDDLNVISTQNVNSMIRIVHELESVGDACFNLMILAERKYKKKLEFDSNAVDELGPYLKKVEEFLDFLKVRTGAIHLDKTDYEKCRQIEHEINQYRNVFKKSVRKRLQAGSNVRSELLLLDMVIQIEHIGDNAINIAEAMLAIQ